MSLLVGRNERARLPLRGPPFESFLKLTRVKQMIQLKKTAEYLREIPSFSGVAKLYKVHPAVIYGHDGHDGHDGEKSTEYIVASATNEGALGGVLDLTLFAQGRTGMPGTYLFPATSGGKVLSRLQLDGSQQGTLDHEMVMREAGYTLVPAEESSEVEG